MTSHIWLLEPMFSMCKAFAISRSYEASESPNFFDVPSNLPFPETSSRLLKNENPTTSSLEITVMPTVTLQRLRKLE
jgi:hypothetical protein